MINSYYLHNRRYIKWDIKNGEFYAIYPQTFAVTFAKMFAVENLYLRSNQQT